jgi:ABC-type Zn uptake system ZnuABC Zn-binding protein ZnuA
MATLVVGVDGQVTLAQVEALERLLREKGIDALIVSNVVALAVV